MAGALGLLVLTLGGCGDDAVAPETTETTETTGTTAPGPSGGCAYYDVDGCTVFGLALAEPLPTAEALASIADLGGVPIAVWRTDYACISHYSMPVGPYYGVPSRFAYVDADEMRTRILSAEGRLSPPITGLDSWNHWFGAFVQEWSKAQEPGVLVEAVAVYLPDSAASALGQDQRFRAVAPLSSYRTESVDPSYAGELMLDGSPELSELPEITCE